MIMTKPTDFAMPFLTESNSCIHRILSNVFGFLIDDFHKELLNIPVKNEGKHIHF